MDILDVVILDTHKIFGLFYPNVTYVLDRLENGWLYFSQLRISQNDGCLQFSKCVKVEG